VGVREWCVRAIATVNAEARARVSCALGFLFDLL
jgi:hypothetical protein